MLKFLFSISIILFLIHSCGTSSNVTSNFSIQKRKYNKGWNVKNLFQHKQSMNDSKESDVIIVPNENHPVSENKAETKTNDETFSTHSSNKGKIINKEFEKESKIFTDEKEIELEPISLIQENDIENQIENDEDPIDKKISPELKKFNLFHKIIIGLVILSIPILILLLIEAFSVEILIPFLIVFVTLYIMILLELFKISAKIPIEEQDEKFLRKKSLTRLLFNICSILLGVGAILGGLAALIFLSL